MISYRARPDGCFVLLEISVDDALYDVVQPCGTFGLGRDRIVFGGDGFWDNLSGYGVLGICPELFSLRLFPNEVGRVTDLMDWFNGNHRWVDLYNPSSGRVEGYLYTEIGGCRGYSSGGVVFGDCFLDVESSILSNFVNCRSLEVEFFSRGGL